MEVEVPFDLIVLICNFLHELREGHPVRLVLRPCELDLAGSVGRRHWPASIGEVSLRRAYVIDQNLFAILQPVGSMEGHGSMVRRLVLLGVFACSIINASGSAEEATGPATKSYILRMVKVPHLLDLFLEVCLQIFVLFNKDLLCETLLAVSVELDPPDKLSNVLDFLGIQ